MMAPPAGEIDSVVFQETFLGRKLWAKQRHIIRSIERYPEVAIKGCHGSGKTFVVSGMVPYELIGHPQSIVLVTAPTLRQVKTFWGEVNLAIRKLPFHVPEPLTTQWRISENCYAEGFSSGKGVNVQGYHGRRVLILADEAIGIGPDIWDAIEGIRSAGDVRIVKLCNPTVPAGPVYDDFTKHRGMPGHKCITISAFDTPNLAGLTLESLLQLDEDELEVKPAPWLTRRRWVKEMYYKWGPDNPRFQSRVLGEFPTQGAWSVFSLEWLERANREPTEAELRYAKDSDSWIQIGVDVAAGGDDETTLCARVNGIILARYACSDVDPRGKLLRWIAEVRTRFPQWPIGPVVVDTVGVGHAIGLHLADEVNLTVFGFKAGGAPFDKEQFINAKSEAYFRLRAMYERDYISHIPAAQDEDCLAQKSSIEYRERPRGQILVEPKDDARKRGVHSPDKAEAEMLAFQRVVPREQNALVGGVYRISPI